MKSFVTSILSFFGRHPERAWKKYRSYSDLGQSCLEKQDFESALIWFEKSLQVCREFNFTSDLPDAIANVGVAHMNAHRYQNAEESFCEAMRCAELNQNFGSHIACLYNLVTLEELREDFGRMKQWASQLEALYQPDVNNNVSVYDVYDCLQRAHEGLGNVEEADRYCARAIELAVQGNDARTALKFSRRLADMGWKFELYDLALDYSLYALYLAETIADESEIEWLERNIANLYLMVQDRPNALEYHLRVAQRKWHSNDKASRINHLYNTASLLFESERPDEALQFLKIAIDVIGVQDFGDLSDQVKEMAKRLEAVKRSTR